jgi:putative N-acetyltransferase (TIGR04045 family)
MKPAPMTQRYTFELARSPDQLRAYLRLRRDIFCDEQALFWGTDADEHDARAYPIVALAHGTAGAGADGTAGAGAGAAGPVVAAEIVGVVRIYEVEPGLWYGGRLGVARAHRQQGAVGGGLIRKAVGTAHAWGCRRFLALVQEPNVPLFERLDWRSLERRIYLSRMHHLMEADLASYPPDTEPRPAMPDALPETLTDELPEALAEAVR